jgi:hypothetical protein
MAQVQPPRKYAFQAGISHTLTSNAQDAFQVSSYVRELRRVGLSPFDAQKQKLDTLIQAFHKFEDRDISQFLGFGIFPKNTQCQACILDTRSQVANLMGRILKGCNGLCLDCIDADALGKDKGECRVKHD